MCFRKDNQRKIISLGLCLAVMLATLFVTGTVFADDEIPAAVPTDNASAAEVSPAAPVEEVPTIMESTPEAPVDEQSIAETPAPSAEETVVPDATEVATDLSVITETPEIRETPVTEVAEASAASDVQVVDSTGESLDMASQDSAELTSSGDPYWKVGTVYYSVAVAESGCYTGTSVAGGTCWISSTPITTALSKIAENSGALLPTDKKLYVLTGTYNGDVNFSGTVLTKMTGLIGVNGSSNITLTGNVTLDGMTSGFTLSGFTITGAVSIVNSSGNLLLDDVSVTNDDGAGLGIGSASKAHSGNVTIRNSSFDHNNASGAIVSTSGAVTVSNSTFRNNGSNDYVGYQGGLRIITTGVVSLTDVAASMNYGVGIEADNFSSLIMSNVNANANLATTGGVSDPVNGRGIFATSDKAAAVTLTGVVTHDNASRGMQINTKGTVTLNDVESYSNLRSGAYITTTGMVKIVNSTFNGNGGSDGVDDAINALYIEAGTVDLNGITASSNNGSGIYIMTGGATVKNVIANNNTAPSADYYDDNLWANSGYGLILGGSVGTLKFDNLILNNNGLGGLEVWSFKKNAIVAKNVEADDNGEDGVWLFTEGPATLTNIVADDNADSGTHVNAGGAVLLTSISGSDNGQYGLFVGTVTNSLGVLVGPTSVTLTSPVSAGSTGANIFEDNGEDGIHIESKGAVSLANFDSNVNTGAGVHVDNRLLDEDSGVTFGNGTVTVNTTISNWKDGMSSNGSYGLYIFSKGNVTLTKVGAESNSDSGIYVNTWGTITLNQSGATSNNNYGAYLDNTEALGKAITVSDSTFDQNTGIGLQVNSKGAITLNGSSVTNTISPTNSYLGSGSASVMDTLNSGSTDVWKVVGTGALESIIRLKSGEFPLTLQLRSLDGTLLDSVSGTGTVSLTESLSEGVSYLLWVKGNETGSRATYWLALDDESFSHISYKGSGVVLNNSGVTAPVTVNRTVLYSYNNFNANASYGLKVISLGAITLNNVNAANNYLDGLNLNNPTSTGIVNISDKTTNPQSNFMSNANGIFIRTKGNILLTGLAAITNNLDGFDLDNCLYDSGTSRCLGSGLITLTNLSASMNKAIGVSVLTNGNISLTTVTSGENGDYGIWLYNQYATGNVALKNIITEDNSNTGMVVRTNGTVALGAITSRYNFKTSGYLNDGDAVSDYYNADRGKDSWGFNAVEGQTYTFQLQEYNSSVFAGLLNLYNSSNMGLSFDSISGEGSSNLIATWTAPSDGYFYVKVGEASSTNGYYQLSLDNESFTGLKEYEVKGVDLEAGKNVTFTGTTFSNISHNSTTGLYISTSGTIGLLNTNATFNGLGGAKLDNSTGSGNVTVAGSNNDNRCGFNYNGGKGLEINTSGTISLNYVNAFINGSDGFNVKNQSSTTAKAFTLKNVDTIANSGNGLYAVNDLGAIQISNINSRDNSYNGIYLLVGSGVTTINGDNHLWDNGSTGLAIQTRGLVSLSGLDIQGNGQGGIGLSSDGNGLITLTNIFLKNSGEDGIYIVTNGAVTLNGVVSLSNGTSSDGTGLHILTDPTRLVTIKDSAFMGNGAQGIYLGYRGADWLKPSILTTVYYGNDASGHGEGNLTIENVGP